MPIDKKLLKKYWSLLKRRAKGEPVAYITGKKEFWSLELEVSPDVLIPRPETEILVEHAISILKEVERPFILDIGTGSGAIAIALAKEIKDAFIWATDISEGALKIAGKNAKRHNVEDRIYFLKGDLFNAIKDKNRKFHLIISNPPYVSEREYEELPKEIRDWEPKIALFGGEDGLSIIRRLVRDSLPFLYQGGYLLIEISPQQVNKVKRIIEETGQFDSIEPIRDYSGRFRAINACKKL